MSTERNVVEFPIPGISEEHAQRIMMEARRLAGLAPGEWRLWFAGSAERLGIERDKLEVIVLATLKDQEKKARESKAEERRIEQRAEKTQRQERQQDRDREREQQRADREAARQEREERERIEKEEREAERRAKERAKELTELLKLPVARHEGELQRLSRKLGEDIESLRVELDEITGLERGDAFSFEKTAPWSEPVDLATLLEECGTKIGRYVVTQPHQMTTSVLWVAHAWLYDHGVPVHSPMLAATSAEPDSGKSTLVAALGRLCPRLSLNIEISGPSLYRLVDAFKPTLVLDEADDLFHRRTDLKHIVNASWTRGAKIPRQAKVNGIWQTVFFDPFGPTAISLLGRNLPPQTRTRCLELRMLPKRQDEAIEAFNSVDDTEFALLRRKLARFAADNAAILKEAKPFIPSCLNNRAAANWKLLLAVAELAGGDWPERAREAAEHLSRSGRKLSAGVRLLASFKAVADRGITEVTSENMAKELNADPAGFWAGYNRGGPITQRQIADLLDPYDIHPVSLHPTKRKDFSRQGYKLSQFPDAFARYLPPDPIIQSSGKQASNKKTDALEKPKTSLIR